jgi:plastocyanin
VLGLAVAATVALAGPVRATVGGAAGGTTVQMVDNEPDLTNWHFDPADVTVAVGSTVVWHNRGTQQHSVTADDSSFDSGLKDPGTDFQRAFPKIGVYSYHCRPHPWMTGKVHVVAADAAAASASTATTATTAAPTTTTVAPPPTTAGAGGAGNPATAPTTSASGGAGTTPASRPSATPAPEAAPAGSRHRSGGHLAGTVALVLGPTLAGLAIGARLRRSTG